MATKLYKLVSTEKVFTARQDLDLIDFKGRAVGYETRIYRRTFKDVPEGVSSGTTSSFAFEARTNPTRNGMLFGASQRSLYGSTIEEVAAAARKRRDGALKRYAKQFTAADKISAAATLSEARDTYMLVLDAYRDRTIETPVYLEARRVYDAANYAARVAAKLEWTHEA